MLDKNQVYPQLLRLRAEQTPDRIYLQRVEGGEFTYGDFYRESTRWAAALERIGCNALEQIAVFLPNGFDAALMFAASGWLRARFTSINTSYQARMLDNVLRNAEPRCLVIAKRYVDRLDTIDLQQTSLRVVVVIDDEAPAQIHPSIRVIGRGEFLINAEPQEFAGPDYWDVASVIYTSGTTGPSKGVLVHWAQLHATSADESLKELGDDACWFSPLPMFHVSGQSSLYKMALGGGRLVLREVLSLTDYFADIERFGVTGTVLMESMIGMLMRQIKQGVKKPPTLKYFIMVPVPDNIDDFKTAFDVRIGTMYNMTEISGPLSSRGFHVDNSMARSCGFVRPGYELRVVDEHDEPVGPGQIGELIVRSDQPWVLNGGYLNNPQATAEAWRNGWFHTGDGFRYDEAGRYYFIDRMKDAIRRRGENISSMEVEIEIAAHEAIAACAVVAAHDDLGQEEVKAFIVLKPEAQLKPFELIDFLRSRLPHFMIPRFIEFIADLPRTPSQKVEKYALRQRGNTELTWDREAHGVIVKRT
jgi:crotonobetaine/carnitine-CoA ligase